MRGVRGRKVVSEMVAERLRDGDVWAFDIPRRDFHSSINLPSRLPFKFFPSHETSMKFTQILPDSHTRHLTTIPYISLQIVSSKTSSLLLFLATLPIPPLPVHLKRARRNADGCQVLVCRVCDWSDEVERVVAMEGVVSVVLTSEFAAVTKSQYEVWTKVWPISFHSTFSDVMKTEEKTIHESYMRDLVDKGDTCTRLARLVHPKTNNSTFSDVMKTEEKTIHESMRNLVDKGDTCTRLARLVNPKTNQLLTCGVAGPRPLDHAIMTAINTTSMKPLQKGHKRSIDSRYLLSDLVMYLDDEPCCMCAMALVHSRIGKVFYIRRDVKLVNDGSGEVRGSFAWYRMNCRMNHKFPVYEVDKSEA